MPSFDDFPQPPENSAGTVARALEALLAAQDREQSDAASHRVLFSVGNSHAGTYFPVVLPAIAALGDSLKSGSPWAQRTALEVLIDWYCSFVPEIGFEVFSGELLANCVRGKIRALLPDVRVIAQAESVAKGSALELQLELQRTD